MEKKNGPRVSEKRKVPQKRRGEGFGHQVRFSHPRVFPKFTRLLMALSVQAFFWVPLAILTHFDVTMVSFGLRAVNR